MSTWLTTLAPGRMHGQNRVVSTLVALCFIVNIFLSIILVRLSFGGLPLRIVFSFGAFALLVLFETGRVTLAIERHKLALTVIGAAALLAIFVSVVNGTGIGFIARQLIEVHLQAAIMLLLTAVMIDLHGLRHTAYIFLAAVLLTSVFAIGQFLNISPFWSIRVLFGQLQGDDPARHLHFLRHQRAQGLSYSAVHLGTQLAFAVTIIYFLRIATYGRAILQRPDIQILAAMGFMFVICVASGNRSPILGLGLFGIAYMVITSPRYAIYYALGGTLMLPVLFILMGGGGDELRALQTNDGSAAGRAPLRWHGFLLFLKQPFGYGLEFDSRHYAADNWRHVQEFSRPLAIFAHELHCFQLNVMNKYGIGLAGIIALTLWGLRSLYWAAFPFLIYAIHVTFHNAGPLNGEFMFWPLIAIMGAALREAAQRHQNAQEGWSR